MKRQDWWAVMLFGNILTLWVTVSKQENGSSRHDCQAVLGQSSRGCYDLIYYLDGRWLRPSLLQSHPNFCLHSDKAFVSFTTYEITGFTLTLFWDKSYYDKIYIVIIRAKCFQCMAWDTLYVDLISFNVSLRFTSLYYRIQNNIGHLSKCFMFQCHFRIVNRLL